MGMYSSFDWEDIKVTDAKGLTEFLFKLKKEDKENNYNYMYEDFLNGIIDGEHYSFEAWDNLKLISYWYPHQLIFLTLIAKYIEGEVYFTFETGDEKAKLEFIDGEFKLNLGEIAYREVKPNKLLSIKNVTIKSLIDNLR